MSKSISLSSTQTIIDAGGIISARSTPPSHTTARMEIAWLLESLNHKPGSLIDSNGYVKHEALDSAVRRYQTQHGLTADGQVGEHTFRALSADQSRHNIAKSQGAAALKTPCNPFGIDNFDHPGKPMPCNQTMPCKQLEAFVATVSTQAPVKISAMRQLGDIFSLLKHQVLHSASMEVAPPAATPLAPKEPSKLKNYIG